MAKAEGKAEGLAEGKKAMLSVARYMLTKNVSIQEIKEATGLSECEIAQLL